MIEDPSCIESVRKRPGMYVGTTGYFGLIHYMVCPFSMLLSNRPTRIHLSVTAAGFALDSDASIPIKETRAGLIVPFESEEPSPHRYEGTVLNGLSESLDVQTSGSGTRHSLSYRQGLKISSAAEVTEDVGTRLVFNPDPSIFTVTDLSPAIFESYLRRMSFLHPGVRLAITLGGETREHFSPQGLRGLFDSISAPYQLLHTPIHVVATEGDLRLELVFAFQSWVDDLIWTFVNNGRAVQGGTHEVGLRNAIGKLKIELDLPRHRGPNGVVALMSMTCPTILWQGCIKAEIRNPELIEMVSRLVIAGVRGWIEEHPDVGRQLTQIEPFVFPDFWYPT